jgi:Ca2+-binding RTX toxin-like protein
MAKERIYDSGDYSGFGSMHEAALRQHSHTEARFVETNGDGNVLVVTGEGMQFHDGSYGAVIRAGTITGMTEYDRHGNVVATLTGVHLDALQLPHHFTDDFTERAEFKMLKGDDTIVGSSAKEYLTGYAGNDKIFGWGGDDYILGGTGNDTLSGGRGDDVFYSKVGDGSDVITDFKAFGDHDLIVAHNAKTYTATQQGDDTLVTFNNGISVLLQHFDQADLQASDILF